MQVVANYAHIAPKTLNGLFVRIDALDHTQRLILLASRFGRCAAYLLSRAAYNVCYITNTSQSWSHLRSVVFYVGHVIVMSLFVMSGKGLSRSGT